MEDKELSKAEFVEEQTEKELSKKEKRDKYKDQVVDLETKLLDVSDRLLRNAAELENFKRRMISEKINDRKFASMDLIGDLLQSLDRLDKAVNMVTDNSVLKNFLIGFKMINDQMFAILEEDGLKKIEALNMVFNPNCHYAVEKICDLTKENGLILEETQSGYTYKEKLLRPAMVKVNEWSDENGENK